MSRKQRLVSRKDNYKQRNYVIIKIILIVKDITKQVTVFDRMFETRQSAVFDRMFEVSKTEN